MAEPIFCKGDADIFRLAPVYPATKRPAPVHMCTIIDKTAPAKIALPAKGLHIDRHAVTWTEAAHRLPHLFHHAHHLMAHDHAGLCARHAAVLDMQVARANGGERHADDCVPRLLHFRHWPLLQCKQAILPVDDRLHHLIFHS